MGRIVLITNIPAPYRIPILNLIAEKYGDGFTVIYCAKKESNRKWDLPKMTHNYIFLKENIIKKNGKSIHNNPGVLRYLNRINSDIVVTTGFNLTFIYAFLWSLLHRKKHIPMTDGTLLSESFLTWKHRLARKFVYEFSSAFIGASEGSENLYMSYGIPENKIFRSPLCIDNKRFGRYLGAEKKYDVMFSGQFIEGKMPFFFLEVVKKLKEYKRDLKVLLIGLGPLEDKILKELNQNKINYDFPGFIQQENLPKYYASSKLLLFPTQSDPWGIVANEASAVGTPVITCDNAGAANDLIINKVNGFVLPLDSDLWAKKILELLNDKNLYDRMSKIAIKKVQEYNFGVAAKAFIKACEKSLRVK
jgi:glycosyltransferase involved in cell wall biosynthesis